LKSRVQIPFPAPNNRNNSPKLQFFVDFLYMVFGAASCVGCGLLLPVDPAREDEEKADAKAVAQISQSLPLLCETIEHPASSVASSPARHAWSSSVTSC
jgi:hypothetical protein